MQPTMSLNSKGLSDAFRALSKFGGVSVKTAIKAEAGSILKTCAGRTKVASIKNITINERLRIVRDLGLTRAKGSDISINVGLRGRYGRVWRRTRSGKDGATVQLTHEGGFKPLNRHYKNGDWVDLKEAVEDFKYQAKKRIPAAKKSQGLARQSWVQIADSIGYPLERVPGGRLSAAGLAKARRAIPANGRRYKNGLGREELNQRNYVLNLINRLPYNRKIGLDRVLIRAVNGRVSFFKKNMKLGVFNSMSKLLRAYPGLKVLPG